MTPVTNWLPLLLFIPVAYWYPVRAVPATICSLVSLTSKKLKLSKALASAVIGCNCWRRKKLVAMSVQYSFRSSVCEFFGSNLPLSPWPQIKEEQGKIFNGDDKWRKRKCSLQNNSFPHTVVRFTKCRTSCESYNLLKVPKCEIFDPFFLHQ